MAEAADFAGKKKSRQSACCGLMAKKEPPFSQTIVLLRHSERLDYVDLKYLESEQGKAWPNDAPLTDRGHTLANSVANEIKGLHSEARFVAVATSPYRRCLETAAAVAKAIGLPVIVDQELGEVWGRDMPQEPSPFRAGTALRPLIESLNISDANPTLEDGSLKLFGKPPKWPESLDDAKTRYLVRIETYIEQSAELNKNYILVTHADAVAAALQMFEHGNTDVQDLDFCARVIASRTIKPNKPNDAAIYGAKWNIKVEGVKQELMQIDKKMEKYYEKQHMENVEEKAEAAAKRKANRTKTDARFAETMKQFAEEDDEEESDAKTTCQTPAGEPNSPRSVKTNKTAKSNKNKI